MREGEEKLNRQVIKSDARKVTKLERLRSRLTSDSKVEPGSRLSLDMFESIFDAISDWVFLVDIKCRILESNTSGEKFTGICPGDMIGKSCCKLIHGSTKHISGCPFKEAIRTGRRASSELWEPKSQRCFAITIDPIRDEKGQIKSAVHIIRDITQQKKVEESLKASEEKFRGIFKYANDGIAYLDGFGRILDVNEKVEQIFGGSRSELINKHFTKLGILSVGDIPKYIRLFQDILKGKVANLTVPITNIKGREVFLECSASLIKPEGESTRIMVIARDITERKKAEEELRIKDKAISTSINAIAIAGLDGNLAYVNNAFIRMWGYDEAEEVLGRASNHFWRAPERLEGKVKAFSHGGGWIDEVPAQRRDGSLFIVQLSTSVILNQIGKPCNIMTSFIDITERKKAEKMLRESEERFKSVFENALVGLYRTTPDGRILMANPALTQMLGYSSFEELVKRNLEKGGFEPDYPRSQFKQLIEKEGRINGLESAWYKRDGTVLFVRESARIIRDKDGNALYYEGTVENVTERQRAEDALQKEHTLLRLLIDNIPDRIYLKDRKHRFILSNDTVVKYEGFQNEKDLLGKTDFDLYPKELAERFCEVEKKVILKHRPLINKEELFISKQGSERWTLTTKLPLQDKSGNIIGIVGIHRDITELKQAEQARREAETKYRKLFENLNVGVYRVTPGDEGRFINVNPAYVRLLGYEDKAEVLKLKVSDTYIDPSQRALFNEKVTTNGFVKNEELLLKKKDGTAIIVSDTGAGVYDKNGKLICFEGILEDITTRKLAQESLQRSEEKYRDLIEKLEDIIYTLDDKGNITFASPAVETILGYRPEEITGKNFMVLISEEWREKTGNDFNNLLKTGEITAETVLLNKNGQRHFIEYSSTVIKEGDKVVGMRGIIRDITERKQAEQALRESEERFRRLAENAPDIIYRMSLPNGKYEYISSAALSILGYSPEEFYHNDCLIKQIIHPSWLNYFQEQWEKLLKGEVPKTYDYQCIHKSGKIRWLNQRNILIRDDAGNPIAIEGIVTDITERRQAEEALQTSKAQLSEALKIAKLAYWEYDVTENMFTFNDQFYNVYHTSAEQVGDYKMSPERYARLFLYPEDMPLLQGEIQRAVEAKEPNMNFQAEHRFIYGDGKPGYVSLSYYIIKDDNGRTIKTYGVNQDITERRQAEQALRESEELFRSFVEQAPEGICVHDLNGDIFIGNEMASKYTGYSRQEILKMNVAEIDASIIEREHRKKYWEKLRVGECVKIETINKRKDSSVFPAEIQMLKIIFNGKPMILAFIRDLTERKRMEEALRERTALLKEGERIARFGSWSLDLKTNKINASDVMLDIYQYRGDPETLDVESWLPYAHPEDVDRVLSALQDAASGIRPYDIEFRIIHADGEERIIWAKGELVRDESGKPLKMFGTGMDITERKQFEESLRKYHIQLQSLASQLTLAEERERRRIATALHDQISQPLAISKIKIEELLCSEIKDNSHKILIDVRDWLSKAMMDTRLLTSNLSSPVLYELGFEKAVASWLDEEIQEKHNIMTELSVDGKLKYIDDDIRALLFRDVKELLFNVVKHARAGKVKVSINKVSNMIRVKVEDDGIGFEPAKLSSTKGAAFGLFSIRERLEHMGGRFEIDSAPGSGCRIMMLAPLKREKASDGENK